MKHKSKKRTRKYIKKLRKSKKRTRKYIKKLRKSKKRMNYKSAKKRFRTRRYKRNARKHYKKGGAPTLEQLNQKLIIKNKDLKFFIREGIETDAINQEIQELKEQIEAKELEAAIADVEAAIEAEGEAAAAAIADVEAAIEAEGAAAAAGPPPHEQHPGAAAAAAIADVEAAIEAEGAAAAAGPPPHEQHPGAAAAAGPRASEALQKRMTRHNYTSDLIYKHPSGGELWLGPISSIQYIDYLKFINCKHIISVMFEAPPIKGYIQIVPDMSISKPIPEPIPEHSQLIIPVRDNGEIPLSIYFDLTSEFIDNNISSGNNVLVHCSSGVSRSSTIVIAYLMNKQEMTLGDAYTHVYERRNMILPGKGFFRELMDLDLKLYASNSMGLKEYYAYTIKKNVDMITSGNISLDICLSTLEQKYPKYLPDTLKDVQIHEVIEELTQ